MKSFGNNAVWAIIGIFVASAVLAGGCSGGGDDIEETVQTQLDILTDPSVSEPWEKTAVAARTQIADNYEDIDYIEDIAGVGSGRFIQSGSVLANNIATIEAENVELEKLLATPTPVRESRETATAVAKLTATASANLPATPDPSPTAIPVAVPTPTVPAVATQWVLVETKVEPDSVSGEPSVWGLYLIVKSSTGGINAAVTITNDDGAKTTDWSVNYTFGSPPPNLLPGQTVEITGNGVAVGEGRLTFGMQSWALEFTAWAARGNPAVRLSTGLMNTNNGPYAGSVSATFVIPEIPRNAGVFTIRVRMDNCLGDECGVSWVYDAQ